MTSPSPPLLPAQRHKYPMISMPEAVDIVLSRVTPLPPREVPFTAAMGHVLAADVVAALPHPPFQASVMDGYAVRAADCPGTLVVTGASRAGAPMSGGGEGEGGEEGEHGDGGGGELAPGEAAYITTGAPLPRGADAVVQLERCDKLQSPFGPAVYVPGQILPGAHVRPVGYDIASGEVVVPAGAVVGPHEIGIMATVGAARVVVHGRPTLAVLSTGDELADLATAFTAVSAAPSSGAAGGVVYDANRPMLAAGAAAAGAEVVDLGVVRDDPRALAAAVEEALRLGADVLVTSGGVSEGDRDYLKEVLLGEHSGTAGASEGAGAGESDAAAAAQAEDVSPLTAKKISGEIHFGRVMMKPGKPLTFAEVRLTAAAAGHQRRSMLVFAVPGNPVSAAVTFQLTVLPALRRLMGWRDPRLRRVHCVLAGGDLALDPERPEYHRATLDWTRAQGFDAAQLAGLGAGPVHNLHLGAGPAHNLHLGAAGAGGHADAAGARASGQAGRGREGLPSARSTGRQVSSRLTSMSGAEVLLELPRGPGTVIEGTVLSALVIGDLGAAAIQLPVIVPSVARGKASHPATSHAGTPATAAGAARASTAQASDKSDTRGEATEANETTADNKEKTAVVIVVAAVSDDDTTTTTTPSERASDEVTALVEAVRRAVPSDWTVSTHRVAPPSRPDGSVSAALADGVKRAARGAALAVVAPVGEGGVTSAAAVVRGTRRGVPGVAWHMRAAVAEVAGDGVFYLSSGGGVDDAAAAAATNEAAGDGINAGQVDGCVVVSAPPRHAEEALRFGLGELLSLPYQEWGLTTRVG